MYFLIGSGIILIIIGLIIASLALMLRWKAGQIHRSWRKDANVIQFLSLLSLFLIGIWALLLVLKIMPLSNISFLILFLVLALFFALSLYSWLLARRKKSL